MLIKHLDDLLLLSQEKEKINLVLACAEDEDALSAVLSAAQKNVIIPIFIGSSEIITQKIKALNNNPDSFEIVDQANKDMAINEAISLIKNGRAQVLMKGLVSTSKLLSAVLDKKHDLVNTPLLSHFALFESPYYHKLFGISDAAINIAPTLKEKEAIIDNAVSIVNKLGLKNPKVALITPIAKVNPKIQSTVEADKLKQWFSKSKNKNLFLDGPLALDNAISMEAAKLKGIESDVAGDADILIPHNLDVTNVLYKSINFLGGGKCAAIVYGAKVPIVLTSRADDEETKLYSIALSTFIA